jgi:hypothetical protein
LPTTTSPEFRPIRTGNSLDTERVGEASKLVAQVQSRVAGPLCMVFVRDRRAEERHDAVAEVLVHRALEAVHALGQDREEAVEDLVPDLGVHLLGQLHRALHVGEEHGHLLALAFEGGLRLQDLVGQVLRGVVAGRPLDARGRDRVRRGLFQASAAAVAEGGVGGVRALTGRAQAFERCTTARAEGCVLWIGALAAGAGRHAAILSAGVLRQMVAQARIELATP